MDIFLLVLILAVLVFIVFLLIKNQKNPSELIDIIKFDRNTLDQRLLDLQKNLGEIGEIGRSMRDFQEFLKSPKVRGNVGEHVLNQILSEMLPKNSFHLQYSFASGEKVDAAIKTTSGIIPIDSKFPMENFRKMGRSKTEVEKINYEKMFVKDIKNHIDAISKKYILPSEGTIDYALMYIPSEAVYYEVVNNEGLFEYAGKKGVLPVSPSTFYAYMKIVLTSFEGQKIEKKAKEILTNLKAIQKDYEKVEENLSVLQKHVTNAKNTMDNVTNTFGKLGQKISQTKKLNE